MDINSTYSDEVSGLLTSKILTDFERMEMEDGSGSFRLVFQTSRPKLVFSHGLVEWRIVVENVRYYAKDEGDRLMNSLGWIKRYPVHPNAEILPGYIESVHR